MQQQRQRQAANGSRGDQQGDPCLERPERRRALPARFREGEEAQSGHQQSAAGRDEKQQQQLSKRKAGRAPPGGRRSNKRKQSSQAKAPDRSRKFVRTQRAVQQYEGGYLNGVSAQQYAYGGLIPEGTESDGQGAEGEEQTFIMQQMDTITLPIAAQTPSTHHLCTAGRGGPGDGGSSLNPGRHQQGSWGMGLDTQPLSSQHHEPSCTPQRQDRATMQMAEHIAELLHSCMARSPLFRSPPRRRYQLASPTGSSHSQCGDVQHDLPSNAQQGHRTQEWLAVSSGRGGQTHRPLAHDKDARGFSALQQTPRTGYSIQEHAAAHKCIVQKAATHESVAATSTAGTRPEAAVAGTSTARAFTGAPVAPSSAGRAIASALGTSSSTGQELGNGSAGVKQVWIMGHSFIHWAEERAAARPYGRDLGLPQVNWAVRWFGVRGMRWSQLRKAVLRAEATAGQAPEVVVLHLGGNDLGKVKSLDIIRWMREDLEWLRERWSQVHILWSSIIPRLAWRGARAGAGVEKARKRCPTWVWICLTTLCRRRWSECAYRGGVAGWGVGPGWAGGLVWRGESDEQGMVWNVT
ncbi:uncharacterized protein LOC135037597 isoform X1 [Pseudophryne corroboree]|uniref:uncharacterized protein LOC135037597 isoform X1 n=1 Tax=Pseudophryne corroboree TaxID=495146 RepID=UPI003081E2CF